MNNNLLNQDNIISAVSRVSLITRQAKSGNDFTILTLRFKNGLEIDFFVDKKRQIWSSRRYLKNLSIRKNGINPKRGLTLM